MWFKQACFFQLAKETLPEVETLAARLAEHECAPVMGLDWFSEGFAAPYHGSPELVFVADFTWSVALKRVEKVLPAAVVREFLDEKVAKIQEDEHRVLGRKEKQELKEAIIDDLLPRAFSRSSRTMAVCDTRTGWLMVASGSLNKAENVLTQLREALGGLEARVPHTKMSPSTLMTQWLERGACDGGFELDSDVALKGQGDAGAVVKIAKQDLTAKEVVHHLESGKTVQQMGLVWRDRIAFILTHDFVLKRIQYLDILQEQAENHGDDAAALAFASQVIMAESLSEMMAELVSCLGGWAD